MSNDVPSAEFVAASFQALWPVVVTKDEAVQVELLDVLPWLPLTCRERVGWAGDHWHILIARDILIESCKDEPSKGLFLALCHAGAHVHLGHHGRGEDGFPPLWDNLGTERAQMLGAVEGPAATEWIAESTATVDTNLTRLEKEANQLAADWTVFYWPVLVEQWGKRHADAGKKPPQPAIKSWHETKPVR